MKVSELIKRLKTLDPDSDVSVKHKTYGEWGSFDARSQVTGLVKRKHGAMIVCKRDFLETGYVR